MHTARCDGSPDAHSSRRSALVFWLALAIVAALALLLRAVTAGQSLWVDELHTAWTVDGTLGQVATRARAGNQPPLYFWLVWFVTRVVGTSEISLRLPSLLAGSASVVLAASLVRQATGSWRLAGLTSLLVAVDPQAVDFAREARPYACVQLLALLQIACFVRLHRGGAWWIRPAWLVLSWAMFFTHYTSALLLLAEATFLVLAWPIRSWQLRRDAAGWLLDFLVCAAGMVLAASPLGEIAARRANWARFVPQADWTQMLQLFAVPVYVVCPAVVLALLAAALHWRGNRWSVRPHTVSTLLFSACWYWVPVFVAWLATQQDWARLFFRRYLIVVGLAPMMTSGVLGTLLPPGRMRAVYILSVLLIVGAWLMSVQPLTGDSAWWRHRHEDWRAAVAWINSESSEPHLPVYLRPGLIEDDALRSRDDPALAEYCRFPLAGIYRLQIDPSSIVVLPSTRSWELAEDEQRPLRQAGGAWFVLRQRPLQAKDTMRQLQQFLTAQGCPLHVRSERVFGNVTVCRAQTERSTK